MNLERIGIIALVIGVVAWVTRQAARVDVGSASLSKFRLEKNGIRINVKIPVLNRSDISTKVTGFLGSLRYQDNILGNISLVHPLEIPRRASAEPEFSTLISYGSVAAEVWAILQKRLQSGSSTNATNNLKIPQTGVNPSEFSILGTLYMGAISIDLNEKVFE